MHTLIDREAACAIHLIYLSCHDVRLNYSFQGEWRGGLIMQLRCGRRER